MTYIDRIVFVVAYLLSGLFMYGLGRLDERTKRKEKEGRYDLHAEGTESDW